MPAVEVGLRSRLGCHLHMSTARDESMARAPTWHEMRSQYERGRARASPTLEVTAVSRVESRARTYHSPCSRCLQSRATLSENLTHDSSICRPLSRHIDGTSLPVNLL